MEEIQLLLEEAKKGIVTMSDFYEPEILNYFYIQILFPLCISVFLTPLFTIPIVCSKKDWWIDKYNMWSVPAIIITMISCMLSVVGVIMFISNSYLLLMLHYSPKIYITKELLNFF